MSLPAAFRAALAAPAIAIALALAATAPAAHAQSASAIDPARVERAERLLELARPEQRLEESISAQGPGMQRAMEAEAAASGRTLPDDAGERMAAIMAEESALLFSAARAVMISIYASELTVEEMDALIALYETPAGASVMRKLPALSASLGRMMQPDILAFSRRLQRRIDAEVMGQE